MEIIDERINAYIEAHTKEEDPVLKKLNRETYMKVLLPRMLSGHFQGNVLKMISHMIHPFQVLEIGTFTGYSAICLAAGLRPEGVLHTIDINEELAEMVNKYIHEANLEHQVVQYTGDALDIIPTIDETFDLVFIDADKVNYPKYYDMVFDKVRQGGFIIADNVLWSGKVVSETGKIDKDTQVILDFNTKIQNDERVENVLLPVRDGLMIVRKK